MSIKFIGLITIVALILMVTFPVQVLAATYTITVNSGTSTGAIKHGATSFLHGLGDNNQVPDHLITGLLKAEYSGQMAPGGAQHTNGDAFRVVAQAKRTGMKGIDIYMQDYYAQWPYPQYGVDSYIANVVDVVTNVVKNHADRTFFRYVPFNEPDWIWYSSSGTKLTQFFNDWKKVYDRIRSIDPGAKIIGPAFCVYSASAYDTFFKFAKDNNCLPDVTAWHELYDDFATNYYNNYNNYRSIESKYGISAREVYINEYGRQTGEMGRPGRLIQFITRFEKTKVTAAMAAWAEIGYLDDLVSSDKRETGAWYLYQWYGQMTGNTVDVVLPDVNGPLQALATKSGTNAVKVIFGGSLYDTDTNTINVVVKGLSTGTVKFTVHETNYNGRNYQAPPAVKTSGSATVSNGQITVSVPSCKALSAYLVTVTPSGGGGGSHTFSSGFSSTQGQNNWNYMQLSGSTYSNMSWESANNRWKGAGAYNLIWAPTQIHPDTNDSVVAFIAPQAGTVKITGNPKKASSSSGDGVRVKIMRGTTKVWPSGDWQSITNTSGVTHDFNISVAANERIYFVVNRNSTSSQDETTWNPTIAYQ